MESKIISQEKNPFLEREEFVIEIKNESGVPRKDEVVEDLGKDKELTVVRKIDTNFGRSNFVADVIVYDSNEAKNKYLMIPQKVRKKMEQERLAAVEAEKKRLAEESKAAEEALKAAEAAEEAKTAPDEVKDDKEESTSEEGKETKEKSE